MTKKDLEFEKEAINHFGKNWRTQRIREKYYPHRKVSKSINQNKFCPLLYPAIDKIWNQHGVIYYRGIWAQPAGDFVLLKLKMNTEKAITKSEADSVIEFFRLEAAERFKNAPNLINISYTIEKINRKSKYSVIGAFILRIYYDFKHPTNFTLNEYDRCKSFSFTY